MWLLEWLEMVWGVFLPLIIWPHNWGETVVVHVCLSCHFCLCPIQGQCSSGPPLSGIILYISYFPSLLFDLFWLMMMMMMNVTVTLWERERERVLLTKSLVSDWDLTMKVGIWVLWNINSDLGPMEHK